jgi:uncharacterized membrane protein
MINSPENFAIGRNTPTTTTTATSWQENKKHLKTIPES